jgi:hypothetical protein
VSHGYDASIPSRFLAGKLIDRALEKKAPYAVFVGRTVMLVPADGKQFARLQQSPERMAMCAGVFDGRASVDEVCEAIESAWGRLCG